MLLEKKKNDNPDLICKVLTLTNFTDSLFVVAILTLFSCAFLKLNFLWAILICCFFVYFFSYFFLKYIEFYEEFLIVYYPTRFYKQRIKILYSELVKVAYAVPSRGNTTIIFKTKNNRFTYQTMFVNVISILKLLKKKGLKINIPKDPRYDYVRKELKKFNPDTDEIKF